MKEFRQLGNKIKQLADSKGISSIKLSDLLDISLNDVEMGLAGRKYFSYQQLEKIATFLEVEINELFTYDSDNYCVYSMDFMNEFTDEKNKEAILDIIYDYLDISDAIYLSNR